MELAHMLEYAIARKDIGLVSLYPNASVITLLTTQSQMQAVLHVPP
jgi:hypothetical protein